MATEQTVCTPQAKPIGTLSKKKYYEIEEAYVQMLGQDIAIQCLEVLKNVLNFNPEVNGYNERIKQNIMKSREKLKEQGVSSYVYSGAKTFYHKHKPT